MTRSAMTRDEAGNLSAHDYPEPQVTREDVERVLSAGRPLMSVLTEEALDALPTQLIDMKTQGDSQW